MSAPRGPGDTLLEVEVEVEAEAEAEPEPEAEPEAEPELGEANVRSVRLGHGANCSSVGSVIDTLFLGAAFGGAIFAAVCAAMKDEGVTVVGQPRATSVDPAKSKPGDELDRGDES